MEKIKKVCAMYFSATGTTKKIVTYIAEKLGEKLGAEVYKKSFTLPAEREKAAAFGEDELVVFGTPVYAGRVPNVLVKYLNTVSGNGAAAVPVVLYGNRNYDDGLIELRDILEADGFKTAAAGAFIGEHSFSRVLAKGRPDEKDMKTADEFARKIYEKLESGDIRHPVYVKGESPYRPYYQPRDRKGTPVNILKVKPKTSEKCNDCKICADVCPMGSIDRDNVREFNGICIKCGACIKGCPVGAKFYDDGGYLYHKEELELGYARRAEPELFY